MDKKSVLIGFFGALFLMTSINATVAYYTNDDIYSKLNDLEYYIHDTNSIVSDIQYKVGNIEIIVDDISR